MKLQLLLFLLFLNILCNGQSGKLSSGGQANVEVPNLTNSQISAISNPKQGSIVFNIEEKTLKYYDGISWKNSSTLLANNVAVAPSSHEKSIEITAGNSATINIPQLNDSEIKAIQNPKTGSLLYDTSIGCIRFFNGEIWQCINHWQTNHPQALLGWKPLSNNEFAGQIAVDSDGNIIMAGYFVNEISFGNTTLTASGIEQIFCAKYTQDGTVLWAKKFVANNFSKVDLITTDSNNNIYIGGTFTFGITFDHISLSANNVGAAFITKLNTNGTTIWANAISSDTYINVNALKVDNQNNVLLLGGYRGNLQTSNGNLSLNTSNITEGFITKCNSVGNFQWAKAFTSSINSIPKDIAVDVSNNLYVVGSFEGNLSLTSLQTINSAGGQDIFITKLNSSGDYQWVIREGGINYEALTQVSFKDQKLFLAGNTIGSTTIGGINLQSSFGSSEETIFGSFNTTNQTWNWVSKAHNYTNLYRAFLQNDGKFYLLGGFSEYNGITKFKDKTNFGDINSPFLVRGNFETGNIDYFRKLTAGINTTFTAILSLSNSRKVLLGNSTRSSQIGNVNITNTTNYYQSFISIFTE